MSQTEDLPMDLHQNYKAFTIINETEKTQLLAIEYVKYTNMDYEYILQYFVLWKMVVILLS